MREYIKSLLYFFRSLFLVLLFVAVAYLLGLIPPVLVPLLSAPFVLQNAAVFLFGSLLGLVGFFSMLVFFVLVALGLPLLSGGRGGLEVFFSPSVGFLCGYVLASFVIGLVVQRRWKRISFFGFCLANIYGLFVLYACGIIGIMLVTAMPFTKALKGVVFFVPLDVLKIVFVSFIATVFKTRAPLVVVRKRRVQSPMVKSTEHTSESFLHGLRRE